MRHEDCTYVEVPDDFVDVGPGVDAALEVDVVALLDVAQIQVRTVGKAQDWRICKIEWIYLFLFFYFHLFAGAYIFLEGACWLGK